MDENEFEKLTDDFKGDYGSLLHAYSQLEAKYDRLKMSILLGIVGIIVIAGYILYQNSIWFAGIISAIWLVIIIGVIVIVIIATVVRLFKRR